MLRKKVCLLGAPAVGKTSLARRFVEELFSDTYLSTVGVKIDRKRIEVQGRTLTLLVWDIHGEDGTLTVLPSYLKGAAGALVVVDATRPAATVPLALDLVSRPETSDIPWVLALNKADLVTEWSDVDRATAFLRAQATETKRTSAKTGAAVDEAFVALARALR